jgi:hypothetical protein
MTRFSRSVMWFSRLIVTAATFIMSMIALRSLRDPIAATLPIGIVLTSPSDGAARLGVALQPSVSH